MGLALEAKQAIVEEVNEVASVALSAVVAEYRGLSAAQMTELRAKARSQNVYIRVVRNTLARRAVENTEFTCMQDALCGPLLYAFSKDEPSAAARLLRDFAKQNEALKVTALSIGGQLLPRERIEQVATLPTKPEAIASLMRVMLGPITKFVTTLNQIPTQLVRTVAAVRDQKQQQS